MERKLGEIFTCNGKLYQVVKGSKCENCDINGHYVLEVIDLIISI